MKKIFSVSRFTFDLQFRCVMNYINKLFAVPIKCNINQFKNTQFQTENLKITIKIEVTVIVLLLFQRQNEPIDPGYRSLPVRGSDHKQISCMRSP